MEAQILDGIATVGFPIAVTCYLLYERNSAVRELTKVVTELTIWLKTEK